MASIDDDEDLNTDDTTTSAPLIASASDMPDSSQTGLPYFSAPSAQTDDSTSSAATNDGTQSIKDLLAKNEYLKAAQADIAQGKAQSLKPEDLDALSQRQNTDQLTKLFMNFAGATNRVNAAPYTSTIGQGTEQAQQKLGLQQNLANQALNRGLEEQKLGIQQYGIDKQNMPVSSAMLDQVDAVRAKGGLGPIDRSVSYPMSTLPQLMTMNNQAAKLGVSTRGQDITQQKNIANEAIGQQKNVIAGTNAANRPLGMVPVKDENGNTVQGVVNKATGKVTPLANTVVPQAMKMDSQALGTFTKNLKSGQLDPIQAHTAIQNYDHAYDNLNPAETAQADSLARRQIGAIASKFDQGVKANAITNANQLLGTIAKMEQTQEFNTPQNPDIGKAAFQRTKSALAFATMSQAGKTRPSNFATQFSLGNSFGANIPFTGVPSEKIEELRKLTSQGLGGAIQSAIAATPNKAVANQAAKETFGDVYNGYVSDYTGLGQHGKKMSDTNQVAPNQPAPIGGAKVSSLDDLLK